MASLGIFVKRFMVFFVSLEISITNLAENFPRLIRRSLVISYKLSALLVYFIILFINLSACSGLKCPILIKTFLRTVLFAISFLIVPALKNNDNVAAIEFIVTSSLSLVISPWTICAIESIMSKKSPNIGINP